MLRAASAGCRCCSRSHQGSEVRHACRVQIDVENYTTGNGYFIPVCYKSYWLGYKAQFWGKWPPLDATVPSNGTDAYKNFGRSPLQEPNGKKAQELCTVANSTEAGLNVTFGWSDTGCSGNTFSYVCRIMRARPHARATLVL